ncbi:MAG: phenylalanine--tRNA ligase subunit beta [Terriglobales bacterium]
MKISPQWIRDFVDLKVDERKLAEDLTMAGLAVEGITGEGASTVFEMEITTNRPDAMNHYGIARECSAIYDLELKALVPKIPPAAKAANLGAQGGTAQAAPFPIIIEDAQGCARYSGQVVRNVTIGPSPQHTVERLESVDQRSINNAADATNYVLWELGHPTHVFDLDLLEGRKIVVRRARPGEVLKTLDGVDRTLSPEDLVIADARKPVALAGVIGGEDSKVTENTRNILIEAAWFDPVTIRKTAKRHGLHTDASHRFERGADYAATTLACARVAQLILESAGGELVGTQIDAIGRRLERAPVQLRRSEVSRILGKDIPQEEIERILRRLGFAITPSRVAQAPSPVRSHPRAAAPPISGGAHAAIAEEVSSFTVDIPSWRLDVEREIDLIEEIARIHGYNQFPNTLPEFSGAVVELPDAPKDARIRQSLLALGYDEAMSLTFVSKEDAQAFSSAPAVQIANPLSEEAAFMRTSLIPGMLNMLGWNLNRGNNDVRLFESGNIYELAGQRTEERKRISLGATGNAQAASWDQKARLYTFFDMKGDLETLLAAFEHRTLYFDALSAKFFHPGRSARAVMDGATVARFGQIHPDVASARKLRQDVYVAEIYLDRLYSHPLHQPKYTPIPRYPAIDRDLSFIFDDAVTFERIRNAVDALHLSELRSFVPVEVFRGGAIPAGRYSVLLRAKFQSAERTLRDDEVALWAQQLIKALEALSGVQRA